MGQRFSYTLRTEDGRTVLLLNANGPAFNEGEAATVHHGDSTLHGTITRRFRRAAPTSRRARR